MIKNFPKKVVEAVAKDHDFFFVQVGAHDGKKHDPIHHYVKRLGWRGLLIEPVPRYFRQLKTTYREAKGLKFANYAVAERNGTAKIWGVSERAPWWLWQLARTKDSFAKEVLLKRTWYMPGLAKHVVRKTVKAARLQTILKKHGVRRVSLYVIDVEGYDYEVMKQIKWTDDQPQYVYYEHMHLAKETRQEAWETLRRRGYQVEHDGRNTFAYLE